MKKIVFVYLFLTVLFCAYPQQNIASTVTLLSGSNIYRRVFLFYFPFSSANYELYPIIDENNLLTIELFTHNKYINEEPSTPPLFNSDVIFRIKDIPYDVPGKHNVEITIRCNKKILFKTIEITIFHKDDITILSGSLLDLYIGEITDNSYFKKRVHWRFPLYFDLRLQID